MPGPEVTPAVPGIPATNIPVSQAEGAFKFGKHGERIPLPTKTTPGVAPTNVPIGSVEGNFKLGAHGEKILLPATPPVLPI